jgi:N-acetylglutamate synthase/N-acetylornithine aminotransferase
MRELAADQGAAAARAIMTTDPFPKEAAARISIGGRDDLRSAAWPKGRE